jgi:solute carrier family 45, member 1/2/4
MIAGGAATILSLLLLGWIREIVGGFLRLFGVATDSSGARGTIIFFAIISMCVLDFSINTVQAGIRAFIVDNAPAHQQESANAWASRTLGIGNVLGYVFGYIDLPRYFSFFGNTQFKVLCVIASFSLGLTLLISCLYIKERDPRLEGPPENDNPGVMAFFNQVFRSVRRLPHQIRKVCEVQFFSWIGWFPFLFYITTYIGQLHVNPFLEPDLTDDEIEKLWEKATRVGTLALLIYAIVSFLANLLLPFVVEPSYVAGPEPDEIDALREPVSPALSRRSRSSSLGALPFSASTANLGSYPPSSPHDSSFSRSQNFLSRQLSSLRIHNLTLRRTWILSHILFATCMFATFFISTPIAATIMTSFVGISWSITLWIPFALISAEVAGQDELRREKLRQKRQRIGRQFRKESNIRRDDLENETGISPPPFFTGTPDHDTNGDTSKPAHGLVPEEAELESLPEDLQAAPEEPQDQAGMILGLHNTAISTPQILATLISSVVFRALQKERGVPGDQSVAWVLRMGGVAGLVAAWWGRGLDETRGSRM